MSDLATLLLPSSTRQLNAISKLANSGNLAIGYLRAFIRVLVPAHHAVLADHPFSRLPCVAWELVEIYRQSRSRLALPSR